VSELVYVTTDDCHYCEHGRGVLDELGVARREIRVDSEEGAELAAAGVPLGFLPVLTDGARVLAYGRLSARRLRKELQLA
jgi:glutathione S-transferase